MSFPEMSPNVWCTERPMIVTLTDGDRMPAYPVIGKIEGNTFYFGAKCQDKMWMVVDSMIESPLIEGYHNASILPLSAVIEWEVIKRK